MLERPAAEKQIIRRVMLSQLLFMAGNSLTVGSFFNYFVAQFQPSALWLAAAMIAPETAQSLSVAAGGLTRLMPFRKRNWIIFLLAARGIAMLLPLALFWPQGHSPRMAEFVFILICTGLWYAFQGIAYVNYLSWLSDLVPEVRWGRLLSRRQLAGLLVTLGVPLLTVGLRQSLLKGMSSEAERWSYSLLFLGGGLLCMASVLPMLACPEVPLPEQRVPRSIQRFSLVCSRDFLRLLAARWWLACFQGLTQAVFFQFSIKVLKISLPTSIVLNSLMVLLQLPVVWGAGGLCDRFQDKRGVVWGMLIVSCAVPLWMLAASGLWGWVIGAYVLWSGFGLLNVCGQSLCLKLAPPSRNAGHVALYEQVSGLIAGVSGLIGGWWLDQNLLSASGEASPDVFPYLLIFAVSWAGRLTAPLWLWRLQQPVERPDLRSELGAVNSELPT